MGGVKKKPGCDCHALPHQEEKKSLSLESCQSCFLLEMMNINLYRRRRLRSTQAILTRVQIRDLGRKIGYTSFRQSVEFLMVQ